MWFLQRSSGQAWLRNALCETSPLCAAVVNQLSGDLRSWYKASKGQADQGNQQSGSLRCRLSAPDSCPMGVAHSITMVLLSRRSRRWLRNLSLPSRCSGIARFTRDPIQRARVTFLAPLDVRNPVYELIKPATKPRRSAISLGSAADSNMFVTKSRQGCATRGVPVW